MSICPQTQNMLYIINLKKIKINNYYNICLSLQHQFKAKTEHQCTIISVKENCKCQLPGSFAIAIYAKAYIHSLQIYSKKIKIKKKNVFKHSQCQYTKKNLFIRERLSFYLFIYLDYTTTKQVFFPKIIKNRSFKGKYLSKNIYRIYENKMNYNKYMSAESCHIHVAIYIT